MSNKMLVYITGLIKVSCRLQAGRAKWSTTLCIQL